jgi:hypothetical protein
VKACRQCGIVKPFDEFHYSKRGVGQRVSKCKRCLSDAHRSRKYGLTPQQYDQMYDELQGECPLCQRWYAALAVDHCHKTGKVRGLLCLGCNRSLGYLEDRDWRKRAVKYLRENG